MNRSEIKIDPKLIELYINGLREEIVRLTKELKDMKNELTEALKKIQDMYHDMTGASL